MSRQEDQWYYAAVSGTAEGPVSLAALRAMRRAGHVTDDTPVWCGALADWTTFGQAIGRRSVPALYGWVTVGFFLVFRAIVVLLVVVGVLAFREFR